MTTEQAIKEIISSDYGRIQCSEETMRMAIAALKAQQWISIKDKLPAGECIATSIFRGRGYKECLIGYIDEDNCDTGFSCESEGEILYNVTHWMPMPKPPEEGNAES